MNVVLIDNRDSFTWNLWQQITSLGASCRVVPAELATPRAVKAIKPDRIIISPGPHHPSDAVNSLSVLRAFAESVPMLGVCLGHQCLGVAFSSQNIIDSAPVVMHGKTSLIRHTGASIFQGVPNPLRVGRYHSLVIKDIPPRFELLAWTGAKTKPDVIMGIAHESLPVFGVQFHPESFLTQSGNQIMKNFLRGGW